MIEINLSERDFDYEIQALVSSFFPGSRIIVTVDMEGRKQQETECEFLVNIVMRQTHIEIGLESGTEQMHRKCCVSGEQDFHKREGKEAHPYRSSYKNRLKSLLFSMLRDFKEDKLPIQLTRRIPAWGTMTGVRPAKIPMQELLCGQSPEQVLDSLENEYCCNREKAKLCIEVASREARLLQQIDYKEGYSLYVGIPFCPTTCLYCSFPSYPMKQFGHLAQEYLLALKKELVACACLFPDRRLTSIYLGGGTPTALTAAQLQELFDCIRTYYPFRQVLEVTVEAGRPDSITREKLEVLRSAGVERISVNPQTMQQKTLDLIGRRHTVDETKKSFELAREMGFTNINMDLIIGLPGETTADFQDTLAQIKELNPDSITIHSLVIKRASKLRQIMEESSRQERERMQLSEESFELERADRMEHMLEMGTQFAHQNKYLPYYMYRQKNSAGHAGSSGQENIGYAREGRECLYNILIMEEKQTILAVGAGASTKLYDSEKNMVRRIENVKSITDYIARVDEMIGRKK